MYTFSIYYLADAGVLGTHGSDGRTGKSKLQRSLHRPHSRQWKWNLIREIHYEDLLKVFWENHDPHSSTGRGPDLSMTKYPFTRLCTYFLAQLHTPVDAGRRRGTKPDAGDVVEGRDAVQVGQLRNARSRFFLCWCLVQFTYAKKQFGAGAVPPSRASRSECLLAVACNGFVGASYKASSGVAWQCGDMDGRAH